MNIRAFQIDDNRQYKVYERPDCNLANPIDHFGMVSMEMEYDFTINSLRLAPEYSVLTTKSRIELTSRLRAIAKSKWIEECKTILATPLPLEVVQLFEERKKKAQLRLIKDLRFTGNMFRSLPIHAWTHFKMPYSKITVDHLPKELKDKTLPAMVHLHEEDGKSVTYVGGTDMTETDMRLAINKRNRIISEFIGDETDWYCFFRTMSGVRGTEAPHEGQPHLHFISSAWGLTRDEAIAELTSYRYSLKAATIQLEHRPLDKQTIYDTDGKAFNVEINT